ncbi:50S ribosomal protein L11 [Candidatus Woesearchaeota archaeon]|nr:50S ribosomal protein L11 [Candidatus Woesearchaeota archaeon]
MPKEKLDLIVEGGKATTTPQLAQKLGPLRINISEVIKKINEKTESFFGVKVPIKVIIDTDTKEVDISVGTPPVSELIKNELKLEKGSGVPNKDIKGNIAIEQVIKIANMKKDAMYVTDLKSAVKNVIGSCNSLGVYVENEPAKFFIKKIDQGNFDNDIKQVKKEPSQEKLAELKNKLKEVQLVYMKEQEKIKAEEEKAKEAATAAATGVGEGEKKEETKPAEPKKEEKKKEEKKK